MFGDVETCIMPTYVNWTNSKISWTMNLREITDEFWKPTRWRQREVAAAAAALLKNNLENLD